MFVLTADLVFASSTRFWLSVTWSNSLLGLDITKIVLLPELNDEKGRKWDSVQNGKQSH